MKSYLHVTITIVMILFTSCKSYYQVFEVASPDAKSQQPINQFENDKVKINYNFWTLGGQVYFEITNKTDSAIYLDWNKSHFIYNGISNDYWLDSQETNSFYSSTSLTTSSTIGDAIKNIYSNSTHSTRRSSTITNHTRTTSVNTSSIRPKKIIHIPPNSSVVVSKFSIRKSLYFDCDFNLKTSKKLDVNSRNFTIENTPLEFRNYLTFSTSENFHNQFTVDNAFYIATVSFMQDKVFLGKSKSRKSCDIKGRITLISSKVRPYKNPTSFYLRAR